MRMSSGTRTSATALPKETADKKDTWLLLRECSTRRRQKIVCFDLLRWTGGNSSGHRKRAGTPFQHELPRGCTDFKGQGYLFFRDSLHFIQEPQASILLNNWL